MLQQFCYHYAIYYLDHFFWFQILTARIETPQIFVVCSMRLSFQV